MRRANGSWHIRKSVTSISSTFPLPKGRFTSPFISLHRDDLGPKVLAPKCVMGIQKLLFCRGETRISGETDWGGCLLGLQKRLFRLGETLILQIHLLNRSSCCSGLANLAPLKLFLSPLESMLVYNKNSDFARDCRPF